MPFQYLPVVIPNCRSEDAGWQHQVVSEFPRLQLLHPPSLQYWCHTILMLTSMDELTGVNSKAAMSDEDWLTADACLDKPAEPEQLLSEILDLLSKDS